MSDSNGRSYVKYTFFKADKSWRGLSDGEKSQGRGQFLAILDEFSDRMMVKSYSTVGTRGDADLLIWNACDQLEPIQHLTSALLSTGLGCHLETPYSYLAMTRKSIYTDMHRHPGQEESRLRITPTEAKYLFVYPFVKTRAWYAPGQGDASEDDGLPHHHGAQVPFGKNQYQLFLRAGRPGIYGVLRDGQPFRLSGPGDGAAGTEASSYTLSDTPIFTCVSMSHMEALEMLG